MFLKEVDKGNNKIIFLFLTVLVVVLVLLIFQGLAGAILLLMAGPEMLNQSADVQAMNFAKYGLSNNIVYIVLMASFLGPFFALFVVKPFQHRSFRSIVTSRRRFNWKRVLTGITIWFAILFLSTIVDYYLDPENYILTFNARAFIPMLLISLVFFPFQVGFEEIFFRGFLYQAFGYISKRPVIAWLITSLAFALMHSANPEVMEYGFWNMFPSYMLLGMFLGLITILDGGLELALGVHFINNLFVAVGVNYAGAVLKTDAIYSLAKMDPEGGWIGILISSAVFMAILWRKLNWGKEISRIFKRYPFQEEKTPDFLQKS